MNTAMANSGNSGRSRCGTQALTGLRDEQLQELTLRVLRRAGDVVRGGGRPAAIGLLGSVAMVVTLMRKHVTQEVAGVVFGVSQATVSWRWDLLRPLIGQVLAELVPARASSPGREHCWWTAPSARSGTGRRSLACSPARQGTRG